MGIAGGMPYRFGNIFQVGFFWGGKNMEQPLEQPLRELASLLIQRESKIVFAESCTGGLISATLARFPGISFVHCGSAVVYRLDTKIQWLGIPAKMLIDPGPVSEAVARAMAEGVLGRTPEAAIGVSITGHLGPDAPPELDGQIFVGIALRGETCHVVGHRLPTGASTTAPTGDSGLTEREQRQWGAVEFVFQQLIALLRGETIAH